MATQRSEETDAGKVWTVAEAQAKLAEILKLAESEGPQRIAAGQGFVIVPEAVWQKCKPPDPPPPDRMPMGQWLREHMPRGAYSDIPLRDGDPDARIPYLDWTEDEWARWDGTDQDRS